MAVEPDETVDAYRDLTRYIVKTILGDEVDFEIGGEIDKSQIRIIVDVPEKHRGRVIGRGGRVARSIRNILSAAKIASPWRVTVDIVD